MAGLGFFFDYLYALYFLFASRRIQKMTILINAAKKHQTEVRYCVKNIMVIKQDNDIKAALLLKMCKLTPILNRFMFRFSNSQHTVLPPWFLPMEFYVKTSDWN